MSDITSTLRQDIAVATNLRLYHAKPRPRVSHILKLRPLLWARAHLGWPDLEWKNVIWSEEPTVHRVSGNKGHQFLWAKEEKFKSQLMSLYGGVSVPMASWVTGTSVNASLMLRGFGATSASIQTQFIRQHKHSAT